MGRSEKQHISAMICETEGEVRKSFNSNATLIWLKKVLNLCRRIGLMYLINGIKNILLPFLNIRHFT